MKKIFSVVMMLGLVLSAQAITLGKKVTKTPAAATTSQTVSTASSRKADALYNSLKTSYSQGKVTADAVVDKALYHKVWSPQLAERCLKLVSDRNTRAKTELGLLYTNAKTAYLFPGQAAQGLKLLQEAANAGDKDAWDYMGVYYEANKNYKKAVECFKAAGSNNNAIALTTMGEMYETGKGYKKDLHKARECYRKAAEMGYAAGGQKYGLALQRQWFGDVSMPDAFAWLYISGDLGSDAARSNLELPLRGERFGDDIHTALARRAFAMTKEYNEKHGHKFSSTPLYTQGFKGGIKAAEQAAEQGDDWSLFYIGSMSYNDEFLNTKDDLILNCYEPILKNRRLPAPAMAVVCERLAQMYRDGRGVKANPTKAAQLDRMAADYGSLAAYKRVEGITE